MKLILVAISIFATACASPENSTPLAIDEDVSGPTEGVSDSKSTTDTTDDDGSVAPSDALDGDIDTVTEDTPASSVDIPRVGPDGECLPNCDEKQCGDNGCGAVCGVCVVGETCTKGQCGKGCLPNCDNKICGSDGCSGSCGDCPQGEACGDDGKCYGIQCSPDCADADCGTDGCGGSCGTCDKGQKCIEGKCTKSNPK